MAKTLTPMDAFRKEQKKKDQKKQKYERQKTRQEKLKALDTDELREQLKRLEKQVQQNPADGPLRKKKQELEDTLKAALKKQRELEEEKKQQEQANSVPKTLDDINAANRERYQCPENSIYYHPTLNPFGAPPPGRPQMYRVPPPPPARPTPAPVSAAASTPPPPRGRDRTGGRPQHELKRALPRTASVTKRPGKRPPLPSGPLPPGAVRVPLRPPLPAGAVPFRPPPPPPSAASSAGTATTTQLPPPPPPPPAPMPPQFAPPPPPPPAVPAAVALEQQPTAQPMSEENDDAVVASYCQGLLDGTDDGVVAPYPGTMDDDAPVASLSEYGATAVHDDGDDSEQEERAMQLRSLVPTSVLGKRKSSSSATAARGPLRPAPARSSMNPAPRPAGPTLAAPPAPVKPATSNGSLSTEYDEFMEQMKQMGAF